MLNFKVRTYNPEKGTPENSIFILSRGRNAGKPLFKPCPNCFILYCRNETEKENQEKTEKKEKKKADLKEAGNCVKVFWKKIFL